MIEIGINIVEIVTKGLYTNSLDIFREYIQNSCDAIDDAFDAGILSAGEELITIDIDVAARRITIEDNGAGINTRNFERTMSKIGNSDKTLQTDRGFRGIGRLCGLAYCREARFSSTVKGETKLSTLTIDAERLRREFFSDNKHSAEAVLRDVMIFDKTDAAVDEHFFRVELIDIVDTNSALLDVEVVRDYLAFVAPRLDNLIAMWMGHHERKIFTAQERRPFIAQSRLCNSRRNASLFFFALERRLTSSRRKATD